MELFPTKNKKKFQDNDRVIVINPSLTNYFMERATVQYIGPVNRVKGDKVGIMFDRLVKSKEDTKVYFKGKPGFNAFVEISDIFLINSENFDQEEF